MALIAAHPNAGVILVVAEWRQVQPASSPTSWDLGLHQYLFGDNFRSWLFSYYFVVALCFVLFMHRHCAESIIIIYMYVRAITESNLQTQPILTVKYSPVRKIEQNFHNEKKIKGVSVLFMVYNTSVECSINTDNNTLSLT